MVTVKSPTNVTFSLTDDTNDTAVSSSATVLNGIAMLLWYTVPPVLIVLGTFGNVMIVVVMRGMRASQSTACLSLYFTALALSDQCLLTTSVLWFWVDVNFSWPQSFFYRSLLCKLPKCAWYTCSVTSAWFLVAMTYQRVTSVVAPHRVGVLCTVRRGKIVIAAIVSVACVLNLHFLFTFSYWPRQGECRPKETYMNFMNTFTLLDLFVASVIPFLLLVLGNSVLITEVVLSTQRSQKLRGNVKKHESVASFNKIYPMTITLILTSAAFLLLTLPTCVFDVFRGTLERDIEDVGFNAMLNLTETVCLMLWFAASASNFYLYLLSGSKFREITRQKLCGRGSYVAKPKVPSIVSNWNPTVRSFQAKTCSNVSSIVT